MEIAEGAFWSTITIRRAGQAIAGFALVWLILDDAKMHLNGNSLLLQARQLSMFSCLSGPTLFERVKYVFADIWPVLTGGQIMPLGNYALRSSAVTGSAVVGWMTGALMLVMVARLAWLSRSSSVRSIAFAAYLALVGCATIVGYSMTCSYTFPVVRYFHLALLLPIGCFAAFMVWESSTRLRTAAIVVFVLWGTANFIDNLRVIRSAYANPVPDPHRELTEFLLSHQIRYARANYWDAYVIDFLSRERITVGSWGPARIPEYEDRVDEHRDAMVNIERTPCEGQLRVADWCIQLPVSGPGQGAR